MPALSLAELPEVQEALADRAAEGRRRQLRRASGRARGVSVAARDILYLAIMHPDTPIHELVQKYGKNVSKSRQIAIRSELTQAQLADFVLFQAGKRKRYLIHVRKEGYAFFERPVPDGMGRGDVKHSYMCSLIEQHGKRLGADVAREAVVPGTNHPVDVMFTFDSGKREAYEVVNSCHHNLVSHLQACLIQSKAISLVTVVAATKDELSRAQLFVETDMSLDSVRDWIGFQAIASFMKKR